MRFQHWLLFLISGTLFHTSTLAQERCGFAHLQKKVKEQHPTADQDFENWMTKAARQRQNLRTQSTFSIPVVVHVIHNGEPVGTGANIPDAQILSQIDVLNKDYQRLNADKVNTPAEFASVAAGIDIEFVFARQDPEGLPTSGIVRVRGSKSGWSLENAPEYKAQSYWPSEDYLNIWVVNMIDEYLGFAQFPITSLPGVEGPFGPLTDGIAVDHRVFGTKDAGSFDLDNQYNKGRTTTHEVGHYLGLLHTFGSEGSCNTTDHVDDTPSQSSATLTCPTHPSVQCGHNKMFQNYMDYTDDACMNLFTAGQISRVLTVLQNSPRRNTLSTSHGLQAPVVLALDLEARRIISPFEMTCGQNIIPRVELRNRGTTPVTSAQIQLLVGATPVETRTVSLNMNQLAVSEVSFNQITLPEPGTSSITFKILQVNGSSDNEPNNNSITRSSQVIARTTIPFTEAFNVTPATWQVMNPDHDATWVNVTAPKATTANRAMRMELYNYENTGSKDQLVSNYISVPTTGTSILKFDRAYARLNSSSNSDILRVLVSTGCSADLSQAVELLSLSGASLATASPTTSYFVPSGESQWLTAEVSLAAYSGQDIRIIFESTNGYGNNLYIDNVSVSGGNFNDVTINALLSPTGPVFCKSNPVPVVQVQNLGSTIVSRLVIATELDGIVTNTQSFQSVNLSSGSAASFTLAPVNLATEGLHSVKFTVSNPDAPNEQTPGNNVFSTRWILNTETYASPLRMTLDNGIPLSLVSPQALETWKETSTNYGTSVVYRGYENPNIGEQSWAVTPTIDLSATTEGSLFFDTSYGRRSAGDERLRLLVSEDCGLHYTNTIFDVGATILSNQDAESSPWNPVNETDWTKRYLSLNDFAGKDQVRFAFVVDNGHGNNLYLDNLEWFIEDDPTPPRITDLFTVYSSETNPYDFLITFNLPDKEEARLVVYNTVGQVLIDNILPGALNQTYTVNLFGQSTGIYLVRLQAGKTAATTKLFVGR